MKLNQSGASIGVQSLQLYSGSAFGFVYLVCYNNNQMLREKLDFLLLNDQDYWKNIGFHIDFGIFFPFPFQTQTLRSKIVSELIAKTRR